MIPGPEEEKQIRSYLLGDLTQEEQWQIEERLLLEDDLFDELMLVEDELVDDYLFGKLSSQERRQFEDHFLTAPERKQKLDLAKRMMRYASSVRVPIVEKPRDETGATRWIRTLFVPWWKFAIYAVVLIGLGLWVGQRYLSRSPVDDALVALNQAYRDGRPVEARITGFSYAEFKSLDQRGGKTEQDKKAEDLKIDYISLERAKNSLFGANVNRSDPRVLHAFGKYYLTQREFDKAIDQFSKALASYPNNAQLHSDLGAAFLGRIERDRTARSGRSNEDVEECLKHLNQALKLEPSLPEALFNRALLYQGERLRREAREDWKRYRQLDPNSSWGKEAAENLQTLEEGLNKVSQRNEQLYQNFIKAQREGNKALAVEILGLSYSYNGNQIIERLIDGFLDARLNGRLNEAGEKLQALAQIGKFSVMKTGDQFTADLAKYYQEAQPKQLALSKQARTLMAEAYKLYEKSQSDQAIVKYEEARQLFAQANNTGESLFAEAWIGLCHHQRSDTAKILQIFTKLAPICEARKYLWMEANAYCGLANGHNASGQFSTAINDCLKCGALSNQVGDKVGVIRSLIQRGGFYRDIGKFHEALQISQQGMDLSDEVSAEPRYTIAFYQTSSRSLSSLALFESARAFQLEAVKIAEETKNKRLKSRSYVHLGWIYGKWKKYDEAISSIQRGIEIGRGLADDTGQELVHYGLIHLGNVYREAGKFSQALKAFDEVKEYFQKSGRHIFLYAGSKGRLLTLIAQEDNAAARTELDRVIALFEKYRENIQEESNRNRFFDQEQGIYDVAIDFAYTRLNEPQLALVYSELCRARSLLDATKRGWKTITGPEAPDLKIETGVMPEGPDQIRMRMPDQIQLIEYAVVDSKLLTWVISKAQIESRDVKISRTDLTARVNQYLELVSRPPSNDDQRWREQAADLYDILIRPIEGLLNRQKQLCIIPDKALNRLPFGTLIERQSGKLLLDEYRLLHAPSANLFLSSTEKARRKSEIEQEHLLAVGNPDFIESDFPNLSRLPSAAREAVAIAAYYKSPVLLVNSQARKNVVVRELDRADVVHLALHYEVNSWSPMLSRMPMASAVPGDPGGALHMYELYQLCQSKSLQPRLVVLSACQTTAEDYLGGEGAIGISRPFEAAGIPLVVASLWPVDTFATSDLMIAFHRARGQLRLSTVDALRTAQLGLSRRADKYRHPYYWAAFISAGGFSEY